MDKKKTLIIGLAIIAACIIAMIVGAYVNRSTSRPATEEELKFYAPYAADWSVVPGATPEAGFKQIILSLCTAAGDETVGSSTYSTYTSEQLANYLYQCKELTGIYASGELLYIKYVDSADRTVILAYDDAGLYERGIYDPGTDTFFHELEGKIQVWQKFSSGVQWGS